MQPIDVTPEGKLNPTPPQERRIWITVKGFLKKNTGEFIEIEDKE